MEWREKKTFTRKVDILLQQQQRRQQQQQCNIFFEDAAKVSDLACYYWFMQTDSDQKSYIESRETAIPTSLSLPLVRDRLQALCYVNSFPALKARLEKESRGLQYRPRKRGEKGTN